MKAQTLNAIGLILNIVGVVLVFFFGLPQPSHEEGVSIGFGDDTVFADGTSVKDINTEANRRKRVYTVLAYVALSFLLAGFVCQLIATCWL